MDDLLDLDWQRSSSASTTSTSTSSSKSNGALRPATKAEATKYSSYNFDALTRSLPSTSPSLPSSTTSTTPRPSIPATTNSAVSKTQADDAFSSLLSSFGSGAAPACSSRTNASMADRQKASLLTQDAQSMRTSGPQGDAWSATADWDKLGGDYASTQPPPHHQNKFSAAKSAAMVDVFHDLNDFASPVHPNQNGTLKKETSLASLQQPPRDVFDFSFEQDPVVAQSSAQRADASSNVASATSNLEEFAWDEDVLGALGKPVQTKQERRTASQPSSAATRSAASSATFQPPSPPPHVLGRMVEMGFSPSEARQALAKTSTGLDVEAALDSLLSGDQHGGNAQEEDDRHIAQRLQSEDGRDIELEEYEERESQRRAARRGKSSQLASGRQGELVPPHAPTPSDRHPRRTGAASAPASGEEEYDWQRQADQIYSQASELGATVFTKANALWSSAKAQAQRTLEERQIGSAAGSSGRATPSNAGEGAGSGRASPAIDGVAAAKAWARRWGTASPKPSERKEWEGKPRWMVEAEIAGSADHVAGTVGDDRPQVTGETSGFRDSDTEDDAASSFIPPAQIRTTHQKESATAGGRAPSPVNLWDDAPPAARFKATTKAAQGETGPKPYVSSARWATGSRSEQSPAVSLPGRLAARNTNEAASVFIKRTMNILPEDLAPADSTAAAMKARGNEAFKKGAYGEAEAAYSAALARLGGNSLRRIPLLNNRANARLKNGDAPAASRDASAVVLLICTDGQVMFEPSKVEALPMSLSGEVNLREAYAKALLRRAQAGEMSEKWIPALKDWTILERYEKEQGSGAGSGFKNLKSAQDGIKRCRGMMGGDRGSGGGTATGPPRAAGAGMAESSHQSASRSARPTTRKGEEAGVERVRAANAAQAAEEAAADSLKDSIDARINAWKAGKETNVRALLSSLENVVWDGLGWKKVGMHEVITDAQVKKAYTRAMIKLHPDKLASQSTQLEHRLIGSAVFAVLNEAFAASTSR